MCNPRFNDSMGSDLLQTRRGDSSTCHSVGPSRFSRLSFHGDLRLCSSSDTRLRVHQTRHHPNYPSFNTRVLKPKHGRSRLTASPLINAAIELPLVSRLHQSRAKNSNAYEHEYFLRPRHAEFPTTRTDGHIGNEISQVV